MIMYLLHLIGSAMLIVLVSFILVDTIMAKKALTRNGLIGRIILLVALFLILQRT